MIRIAATGSHRTASARIKRHATGFTLLELLIVILIIGLLAGIVTPRYFDQLGKSNTKIARAQIYALGKVLDQYRLDTGHYPTTEQGLQALSAKVDNEDKWQGPYLEQAVPADPWGRDYIYKSPGDHGNYDLSSLGADGKVDGAGENAVIGSWMQH
ncbi:MAG: ral secretion pathway protein [Herbaspirillum sp.]|jgi:general secretion pathway protein G|nr:ral secretion pathway protein [Herbaspirillum sp.]